MQKYLDQFIRALNMRVTGRYLIVVVVVRANRCIWREKEEYRICIENLLLYLFDDLQDLINNADFILGFLN
ncbi:hypothetical protein BpHYR1_008883 [Brachionus plicatilis]|uniref:Uncharacterized protein n=1 Tax=Brachionus plicatilis TaxID=10195 RepID=A0A3M7R840_BRAPC|nr:hypothetical protein BpHYR1_008883 [Brachionus plicatilis]